MMPPWPDVALFRFHGIHFLLSLASHDAAGGPSGETGSKAEPAGFRPKRMLLMFTFYFRRLAVVLGFVVMGAMTSPGFGQPAGGSANAVPPASGDLPWTLERALARAMEANAELLAAKHEFERQEGMRLQVRARLLPSVSANAGLNERAQGLVDESPLQRFQPPSPENAVALYSYDVRLEIRQLVFDGFSSWNQIKRQQLISRQAYLTLHSTVLRTVSSVRQAFDAIQMRTALVTAEERRVEEFVQLVEWTRRKHLVGEVPEFELLRAEAELQGARAELAEAGRTLGQTEQSFRRLLQARDGGEPLRLDGKFQPRDFRLPLDEAIAQARANRPDLEGAALAVDAARRNERSVAGRYLPRVEAFASYGTRSSYYNSAVRLEGWTFGAMGQWSLFEGGAARGQKISLRAELRAAEDKLSETQHHITSRLRELYHGLQQARVSLEAQERSVGLSTRASRDARRLFEVGQASLEQVLQSGMTHRRAESRFGEAVYNFNAIVADIESSVGGRLADSLVISDRWKP